MKGTTPKDGAELHAKFSLCSQTYSIPSEKGFTQPRSVQRTAGNQSSVASPQGVQEGRHRATNSMKNGFSTELLDSNCKKKQSIAALLQEVVALQHQQLQVQIEQLHQLEHMGQEEHVVTSLPTKDSSKGSNAEDAGSPTAFPKKMASGPVVSVESQRSLPSTASGLAKAGVSFNEAWSGKSQLNLPWPRSPRSPQVNLSLSDHSLSQRDKSLSGLTTAGSPSLASFYQHWGTEASAISRRTHGKSVYSISEHGEKNILDSLIEAAWFVDTTQRHVRSPKDFQLPSNTPRTVRHTLCLCGVLDPHHFNTNCQRLLYRVYHCSIPLSFCILGLHSLFMSYLQIAIFDEAPLSLLVFAFCYFFMLPLWIVASREYGAGGATLVLLQQMCRRGFSWNGVACSHCIFRMFFVGMTGIAFVAPGTRSLQQSVDHEVDANNKIFVRTGEFSFLASRPFLIIALVSGMHLVLTTRLNAQLHQHDLRTYASIVKRTIEEDTGALDLVQHLNKFEYAVSARLHHASKAWVRWAILCCLYLASVGLGIATYLTSVDGVDLVRVVSLSLMMLAIVALWFSVTMPLAAVAETFSEFVIPCLSNPAVLNRSQRQFGQQFMGHLHALDWGFRLGGVNINCNIVASSSLAVLGGVVIVFTRATLHAHSDSIFFKD